MKGKKNAKISSKNDPTSRGGSLKFQYCKAGGTMVDVVPLKLFNTDGTSIIVAAETGTGDPVVSPEGDFVPWRNIIN